MTFPGTNFKPKPRLLERRAKQAAREAVDRVERAHCRARSGGQCEVIIVRDACDYPAPCRCPRRASQNHHLIGGSGRRNTGKSIRFEYRLEVCTKCHADLHGHILVPIDGTKRELAAEVRYERVR
jgi:hypothetical protein